MKSPHKKMGNNNDQAHNNNENNAAHPFQQQGGKVPFQQTIQPVMFSHRNMNPPPYNFQNRGYKHGTSENHMYSNHQGLSQLDSPINSSYSQYESHPYHSQQTPLPNPPPTPFDYAYGTTLLPSHILMNSPFVSTPNKSYLSFQASPSRGISYNRRNSNQMVFPNPPIITSPHLVGDKSERAKSDNYEKVDTLDDEKRNREVFEEESAIAYKISYQILPKGDDTYHTRSLLFENINESIDLHTFIEKFVNYGLIESVYVVPSYETHQNSVKSILLSFTSRSICLDFYNSVLQKLSEYKTQLNSENLKLSFVSLCYLQNNINKGNGKISVESQKNETDFELTSLIQYQVANFGATRSLCIEFDKRVDKIDDFIETYLPFLSSNANKRYIIESLYIVNNNGKDNEFPAHYVILSFLNISMVIEVLHYIRSKNLSKTIKNCLYVSFDRTKHAVSNSNRQSLSKKGTSDTLNTYTLESPINHNTEVDMNDIPSIYDENEIEIANKLSELEIQTHTFNLDISNYSNPHIEIRAEHLPNVSISRDPMIYANPIYQSPPSGYMENMWTTTPFLSSHIVHEEYANDRVDYNMKHYNNQLYNVPLPQTLQSQFATSAEMASKMGGGVGNRTIFIGNINPRSKTEDICNVTRGGIIQQVKYIREKNICFVIFIDPQAAAQFYANSFIDPIILHNNTLKIGWGDHPGPLPKAIELAVTAGASRNVYVSLPEFAFKDKYINDPNYKEYHNKYILPSEQQLREDFSKFGEMEQINFLKDKHCCWINFTNIRSAIKLVELVKNEDNNNFHERYKNRYKGLIIGYGKDRCGNVNKSLVSNKNSRYFRKVKKPSYNIRLQQLEEERKRNDEIKQIDNKRINLDSLGITTSPNQNIQEDETLSLAKLKLTSDTGFKNSENESDIDDSASNSSTDVELIINSPGNGFKSHRNRKPKPNNLDLGERPKVDAIVFKADGPMAPNKLSHDYHRTHNTRVDNPRSERTRKRTHKKIIPGSDVMSQYLAQVQHSTFMYAANVLNASIEEPEFYDENDIDFAKQ
ncbi:hypothetical protein TPHA_0I00270 [Tetrapisispora phaffii CBS 4417]|uniref:RRM domain-containing protein n=1 Tax=Tetrapisispora phaffii (strain ATCC 24235 / CBS 4417 / NBRC 1672 / NRRL Y-8282 / UCD 70-5) TaxID=1071381 RepID=G8BXA6_TETPH|nr:hypothetical protein TPHA_0I00270 [Tetrapisispora phaffii CBS 4417]CCE64534.1 hypothetical protein TPHA_0I00270 [Tetrapisispora phaffii CBS 4417]